jgi:transposase-like protein
MPRGIPTLTEAQKQEIIKRVTDKGERAVDLAKEYKVDPKIIYNLLKTKANQHQAVLELAKLKPENEALISIIGQLVADSKIGKKEISARFLWIIFYLQISRKSANLLLALRLQFLAILFITNQNFLKKIYF